jgi:undecaprenyl-diphosphatase
VASAKLCRVDQMIGATVAKGRGNAAVDGIAYVASFLGDHGLVWFLLGCERARRPGQSRRHAAFAIGFTGLVAPVVNSALKRATNRPRPVDTNEPHRLPIRIPRSQSFPSGHSLAAFCAATVLADGEPAGPAYLVLAAVIAWSRIHVRLHHASDALGGALIGLALGLLGRRLWRELERIRIDGAGSNGAVLTGLVPTGLASMGSDDRTSSWGGGALVHKVDNIAHEQDKHEDDHGEIERAEPPAPLVVDEPEAADPNDVKDEGGHTDW